MSWVNLYGKFSLLRGQVDAEEFVIEEWHLASYLSVRQSFAPRHKRDRGDLSPSRNDQKCAWKLRILRRRFRPKIFQGEASPRDASRAKTQRWTIGILDFSQIASPRR
jgi:hypothetical protein